MRDRAGWMNKASIPILELLAESELALPAGTIYHNLTQKLSDPPSRSTVFRAIDPLQKHDLIVKTTDDEESAHFKISKKGIAYLEGELDMGDLN